MLRLGVKGLDDDDDDDDDDDAFVLGYEGVKELQLHTIFISAPGRGQRSIPRCSQFMTMKKKSNSYCCRKPNLGTPDCNESPATKRHE